MRFTFLILIGSLFVANLAWGCDFPDESEEKYPNSQRTIVVFSSPRYSKQSGLFALESSAYTYYHDKPKKNNIASHRLMILGPNLEVLSEIKFSIDLSTKKANPLFTVTTIGKPLFAEAPIRSAVVDLKSGYFKWRKALPKKPVEFGSLPFLLDQSTLREEYGFVELL